MRITCPHCKQGISVAYREVLAAAERIKNRRKLGDVADAESVNGNVLPNDPEATRLRDEAIERRKSQAR